MQVRFISIVHHRINNLFERGKFTMA